MWPSNWHPVGCTRFLSFISPCRRHRKIYHVICHKVGMYNKAVNMTVHFSFSAGQMGCCGSCTTATFQNASVGYGPYIIVQRNSRFKVRIDTYLSPSHPNASLARHDRRPPRVASHRSHHYSLFHDMRRVSVTNIVADWWSVTRRTRIFRLGKLVITLSSRSSADIARFFRHPVDFYNCASDDQCYSTDTDELDVLLPVPEDLRQGLLDIDSHSNRIFVKKWRRWRQKLCRSRYLCCVSVVNRDINTNDERQLRYRHRHWHRSRRQTSARPISKNNNINLRPTYLRIRTATDL